MKNEKNEMKMKKKNEKFQHLGDLKVDSGYKTNLQGTELNNRFWSYN